MGIRLQATRYLPAAIRLDNFKTLADTCRQHGIIFAPHDNYTDFYPDATASATTMSPLTSTETKKAWFNKGRNAKLQLPPHAFKPWLGKQYDAS